MHTSKQKLWKSADNETIPLKWWKKIISNSKLQEILYTSFKTESKNRDTS